MPFKLSNWFLLRPLVALLLLGGFSAAAPAQGSRASYPQQQETREAGEKPLKRISADIIELVNTHRSRLGRASMEEDAALGRLAEAHSQAMASGRAAFGHSGFSERAASYQKTVQVFVSAVAENVAYGSKSASEVVAEWLNSRGHRRNIEGDFNRIGVGVTRAANGTLYFTQIFARR